MTFTSRTLQQKQGGKWVILNVITDQAKIASLLAEELTVRFVFNRKREVKRIDYTGVGIVVTFDRNTKATYAK